MESCPEETYVRSNIYAMQILKLKLISKLGMQNWKTLGLVN